MARYEKEARQPFTHGDHGDDGDDTEDGSIELPECNPRNATDNAASNGQAPKPDHPSSSHLARLGNGIQVYDTSIPPKKFATYAILFMLGAQIFSASMNVSIRLLEKASTPLHPLQILFVRMSVTTLGITFWLWRQKKPNAIWGRQENRPLLLLRALGGFLGVFGLYYSLRYLNLSEATVITFVMPLVASFGGYLLLDSPLSWLEILLSIVSLFGVLLVASPDVLFSARGANTATNEPDAVEIGSRIWAIFVGLIGVCGSAAAFLCMSAIGKTESPLTVVNYFAALCTLVSFAALVVLPGLGFQAPSDTWAWGLLFLSGLSGFLMQSLITMSLQAEKSLAAVNMVYTQIVFALALDAMVFRTIPHSVSLVGCVLICGSALVLAWHKAKTNKKANSPEDGHQK